MREKILFSFLWSVHQGTNHVLLLFVIFLFAAKNKLEIYLFRAALLIYAGSNRLFWGTDVSLELTKRKFSTSLRYLLSLHSGCSECKCPVSIFEPCTNMSYMYVSWKAYSLGIMGSSSTSCWQQHQPHNIAVLTRKVSLVSICYPQSSCSTCGT